MPSEVESNVPWSLVLTNLRAALEIIHREWGSSVHTVALNMIQRGIPFHTLTSADQLQQFYYVIDDGEIAESPRPIIWSNATQVLEQADLKSYQRRPEEVLAKLNGHKALLMGE